MIQYRPFHNTDPPRLLQLWHSCALGPAAAEGFSSDILELFSFSQPFFDRNGIIVAVFEGRVVGMVHAGFAATQDESRLDKNRGNICALMVHPEFRRQGIATELIRRACDYLKESGSKSVEGGGGLDRTGFYVGIYGGLQPSGFSESAAPWEPVFAKSGFEFSTRTVVMHRDLFAIRDPVNSRLIRNRRNLNMMITDRPSGQSWWWFVRFGHLDSLRFELQEKASGGIVASGQIIGMDVFIPKWGVRSVGIRDVYVPESQRRHGYGLALILEISRRLRDESVQLIEAHVDSENQAALDLFGAAKFEPAEHLVTYRKSLV
ncbi:MAG: GNAT family N-acetyltransferase [Planctomycetaceae bacterium]|nr:GNAT family N-acetyltransferase [Planctomycetaceae bacterium]